MNEDESIEFLQWHIDNSFKEPMRQQIILDIEWIKGYDGFPRAIALMGEMRKNRKPIQSNLICLFPPFTGESYK